MKYLWMRNLWAVHADVTVFDVAESPHGLILDAEMMPPSMTRKIWTNLAVCPPMQNVQWTKHLELHYLGATPG